MTTAARAFVRQSSVERAGRDGMRRRWKRNKHTVAGFSKENTSNARWSMSSCSSRFFCQSRAQCCVRETLEALAEFGD